MAKPSWQTRRVTIKDIAKAAAVDPSTVTRALQGSDRVREATRNKISALAADMGYVPNMAARTLVNRSSGLVGVVIPDMTNPFFADLARGVEDEAAKHDLRVLISDTGGVEAVERGAVNLFLELKVDGLLVPMARCPQQYYDDLHAAAPIVHVNSDDTEHTVNCDTVGASELIMNHLLELGHRRIGFVRGPAPPGREPKMFAYRQALESIGAPYEPELIFSFDGSFDSTEKIAAQLSALDELPTAIYAHNDVNAIALIHALRQRGIAVPDDISVAGHDNIQMAGCIEPALTTVAWPMYELGQQSVRYLYSLGEGKKPQQAKIPPPRLIVRESTGAPRSTRRNTASS
ncbi:MAG: LacI family transcriptional regulator [Gammaproteobacteria bacterium]|nr:LacI family transcriptional regulator [Gammaproteobacteria bacterium]